MSGPVCGDGAPRFISAFYGKDEDFLLGSMVGSDRMGPLCTSSSRVFCHCANGFGQHLSHPTRASENTRSSNVQCPFVGIVPEETKRPACAIIHGPRLAPLTAYRPSPHDI